MQKALLRLTSDYRFWLVVALVITGCLIWFFIDQASATCASPRKRMQMEIFKANSCFEFWVNRYQGGWAALFGSATALGAAWLAWRAVQRQVDKQAAANAVTMLSVERQRRKDLDAELAQIHAAAMIVDTIKTERHASWDGHEHPFVDLVTRLKRAGQFPFERAGPSAHPLVNAVDAHMAKAAKVPDVSSGLSKASIDEQLGRHINSILGYSPFFTADTETTMRAIIDANTTIKSLETQIAAELSK